MFVTGESMNLDLNTLSAFMQLLGNNAPAPKRQEYAAPRQEHARDNKFASPFARENGIGEKVEFGGASDKKTPPQNPMASILDALSGKPANGDMMSALLPTLMNMLKKPDAPAASPAANNVPQSKNEESRAKCASAAQGNQAAPVVDVSPAKSARPLTDAEIFSPISFAGYALISALNILYHSAK